jgi:hypothetical protein
MKLRRTPGSESPYTAFPDLKPPLKVWKEVKGPNGSVARVAEESGVVPLPPLPVVAPAAPPLRKVRFEQLREGLDYIARVKEVTQIGSWDTQFFLDYLGVIADTARVAGTLENTSARRVPWYEARVRALKEAERFTYVRVLNGNDPPQRYCWACFQRLGGEAELLRLKAEVATAPRQLARTDRPADAPPRRTDPPTPRADTGSTGPNDSPAAADGGSAEEDDPPTVEITYERQIEISIDNFIKRAKFLPTFTAFPDLKPPTLVRKEVKHPNGDVVRVVEETEVVPPPPIPVVAADAPLLRRVRAEQLRQGLTHLARIKEVIRIGAWNARFFTEYISGIAETYQVAATLEETPARRVPWYEARVRKYKEAERYTAIRCSNGNDPPQRLNQIRFARLQAEAELLELNADVAAAAPPSPPVALCPCQPLWVSACPPTVIRPRCGCFLHRLRRR